MIAWDFVFVRVACAVLIGAAVGCQNPLGSSSTEIGSLRTPAFRLPSPRLAQHSVVLELAVVELSPDEQGSLEQLWPMLDQQAIALDLRKRLDQNGLRVGLIGSQLPSALIELLETEEDQEAGGIESDRPPSQLLTHRKKYVEHQRIQIEPNEQHWLACSAILPQVSWSITDGTNRRSGVCEQAQFGFHVNTQPSGNGTVQLRLLPVIRHGQRRHRFAVSDDSFLFDRRQEQLELVELELAHPLRPGETIVMATTPELCELGKLLIGQQNKGKSRRFVMVRLLQTQQDDLFSKQETMRPLATSTR